MQYSFLKIWKKTTLRIFSPFYSKEFVFKILCVDDDRTFCRFLKKLGSTLGILVDKVHSIEEAKQVIEETADYQAFIIDGHLPDGAGIELVAWIREKKNLSLPIGFISRIYRDARTFRLLRDKLKVNYVLEKPIRHAEAHQLLIKLSQPETLSESFSNILLENLKNAYDQTISDKIEDLEKMILTVEKNPSISHLQALKTLVHKIAGSAGSFGYFTVSQLCKNLETEIKEQIELAKKKSMNYIWLSDLDEFFSQIKLHFQMDFQQDEWGGRRHHLPSLYIVDEDENLLNQFKGYSKQLHFELLTESNPDQSIQNLMAADFYPQIFLLDIRNKTSSGYELLKDFYRTNDYSTTVIGFTAAPKAWKEFATALQRGITFVAEKPFNIPLVFHFLDQTPFRAFPLPYKILAIDDDPDICQYILQALKYSGLEVQTLHDYNALEDHFKEFQPDLILLELNLGEEAPIAVLEKLRKEIRYKNLIIGMIVVQADDEFSIQQCFDGGIDEIIFKPLDRSILQRKISGLLKKQTREAIGYSENENSLILKKYIKRLLKEARPPFPKVLVMLKIENGDFSENIDALFEDLLKKHELAIYLSNGKFALIFQGYDPNFVQLFMQTFLKNWKAPICESLVVLTEKMNPETALQIGEELLLAAHQLPGEIRMLMEPTLIPFKEVFIFHEGKRALENLKELFKKQNFVVHFKNEIEKEHLSSVIPLLIITDSYGDLEGLPLVKQWWMQNLIQIPVLLLSHWPDANNLHRLLSDLNYFKAPFSLVILINEQP